MTKITQYPAISAPLKDTDLADLSIDKGGSHDTEQATLLDLKNYLGVGGGGPGTGIVPALALWSGTGNTLSSSPVYSPTFDSVHVHTDVVPGNYKFTVEGNSLFKGQQRSGGSNNNFTFQPQGGQNLSFLYESFGQDVSHTYLTQTGKIEFWFQPIGSVPVAGFHANHADNPNGMTFVADGSFFNTGCMHIAIASVGGVVGGSVLIGGTPAVATNGARLSVFAPASSAGRAFEILNSGGSDLFFIDGSGNIAIPNMPTSAPATPDTVWNDGGTLKIT